MTFRAYVRHFHDRNDPDRFFRGREIGASASYATRIQVVELETGVVLAEEWAYCNPRDCPSRQKGRLIVVGRLLKKHPEFTLKSNGRFYDVEVIGYGRGADDGPNYEARA